MRQDQRAVRKGIGTQVVQHLGQVDDIAARAGGEVGDGVGRTTVKACDHDRIDPVAGGQGHVVIAAHRDRVVAVACIHGDRVVIAVHGDGVVARAAGDRGLATGHHECAVGTIGAVFVDVGRGAFHVGRNAVVAVAAVDHGRAAIDRVGDPVVAGPAKDHVGPVAAGQLVVALAAVEHVVARAAVQHVVARAARQGLVGIGAGQEHGQRHHRRHRGAEVVGRQGVRHGIGQRQQRCQRAVIVEHQDRVRALLGQDQPAFAEEVRRVEGIGVGGQAVQVQHVATGPGGEVGHDPRRAAGLIVDHDGIGPRSGGQRHGTGGLQIDRVVAVARIHGQGVVVAAQGDLVGPRAAGDRGGAAGHDPGVSIGRGIVVIADAAVHIGIDHIVAVATLDHRIAAVDPQRDHVVAQTAVGQHGAGSRDLDLVVAVAAVKLVVAVVAAGQDVVAAQAGQHVAAIAARQHIIAGSAGQGHAGHRRSVQRQRRHEVVGGEIRLQRVLEGDQRIGGAGDVAVLVGGQHEVVPDLHQIQVPGAEGVAPREAQIRQVLQDAGHVDHVAAGPDGEIRHDRVHGIGGVKRRETDGIAPRTGGYRRRPGTAVDVDPVVAGPRIHQQRRAADPGLDRVVAVAAEDRRIAARRGKVGIEGVRIAVDRDGIVAAAAVDGADFGTDIDTDLIVPGPRIDGVVAPEHDDVVIASGSVVINHVVSPPGPRGGHEKTRCTRSGAAQHLKVHDVSVGAWICGSVRKKNRSVQSA